MKPVLKLLEGVPVKGLAHITGGGLVGNVPRILPKNLIARIHQAAWPRPEVFKWLQQTGGVAEDEMWRVFNCGIGMVVVLPRDQVSAARTLLEREGERVYEIGAIEKSSGEPEAVIV
ncbi:MAG TPA: AIR synthase-related protein [Burkholderiales bacterium]|nr:AIR synthase-related protein [Burkholderiales bacterium]